MKNITTEDLLSYYHIKSCIDNNAVAASVIKDFENLLSKKFNIIHNYLAQNQEIKLTQQISELMTLRDEFVYTSIYVDAFFSILERYNYHMKSEIKNAIEILAGLGEPYHNKDAIIKLLASPAIDDISFNGVDRFTILSNMYGSFSFFLATSYFKDNSNVLDYLSKANLKCHCHQNTEKLSRIFPEYRSITSLCPTYFTSHYYHSYSYNPDDLKVIDLCSKSVMDTEDYNRLFEPREISVITNRDIEDYYKEVLKYSNQPSQRNMIFKIALYNHLKNMTQEEKGAIKAYKKSQ